MSKRFQPMKEFGRSMKKPKLDISISSRSSTTNGTARPTTSKAAIGRNISPLKSSTNDFWDDDDDDVILLATQVAEAAVAAEKQQQQLNGITLTESEITFSEFGNVATTSTQRTAACDIPAPDILSQMFEDDDDDFELLAAANIKDPVEFKKPAPPPPAPATTTKTQPKTKQRVATQPQQASEDVMEFVLSQNTGPDSTLPSSQSAARRQLASERQIKFLMEKVDALKKENSKLTNDLTEAKEKISSKEGESSLLRDELRHLKQQAQTLRMEKILSAQNAQNECQSKMDEMAKAVQAKEAEVRMKEMECSMVKMRYEINTQRLQQSICDESIRQMNVKPKQKDLTAGTSTMISNQQRRMAKCLLKMPSLDVASQLATQLEVCSITRIHPLIYEQSFDKGSSKKQRTLFQLELENIQTKLAQLQLLGVDKLPDNFIKCCKDSISRVLPEFWSYTHSLEFPKNRRIHPYHDYSLTKSPIRGDDIRCLQEPLELYDDERCLCLRRYLAALSIICQQVPDLADHLLEHKHGEYYLLQIVTDSVGKLGFAREICEHFGVLEALAVWLNSLLLHVTLNTPENFVEMLVDLLKSLVFARPSAWIFREISIALRQCCRLPYALDLLCINSPEKTFVADRVRSTYRFSNQSCLMQVYCGLLEIAFPLSTRLLLQHFKLLAVICLNHVRFVYQCFQNPPKFVQKLLPFYDDEEDEPNSHDAVNNSNNNRMDFETTEQNSSSNSTTKTNMSSTTTTTAQQDNSSVSSNPRCECYVKLCQSVVTLIFQLLRQWLLHKREHCTLQVAEISRLSVQLIHVIFCDNYLTCLFRESEETTKHYLCLIIKWWSDNSKQLQFNDINLKFLQKLQHSHVLPKDIIAETNYYNINVDLSEWQKCTNDNVNHLKPPNNAQEADDYVSKLNLIEDASNQNKFFESLKGFAFNFQ